MMNLEPFDLERWEALSDNERFNLSQQLIRHLPDGFILNRLETYFLETQTHSVAIFDWKPTLAQIPEAGWCYGSFALIPGGAVTLGYDREHPWQPSQAQQESWNHTREEYGVPDLPESLDQCMTALHVVNMNPFLMEVARLDPKEQPRDLHLFPELSASQWFTNDQLMKHVAAKLHEGLEVFLNVKHPPDIVGASHNYGFRSPTSDEWEWACAAGSRTLWRWGDDCPTDGYPSHYSQYRPGWNLHEQPNAFGLTIANDDYSADYCEGGIIRGGDGGSSTCGGAGFLASWLLLVSSHFIEAQNRSGNAQERGTRRVFPLEAVLA